MDISSLQSILTRQRVLVEDKIQAACDRSGRHRAEITLVGITKYVSPEVAALLHQSGVPHLGESRPQELWRKAVALPDTVHWHLVGHLQTNKIEKTLPLVEMIHSVDSVRLLAAIEKEARQQGRPVDVLLEVNASGERQKHGFAPADVEAVAGELPELKQVRVRGLMTMAAYEEDAERCRGTFRLLRELRDRLRDRFPEPHKLEHLSMGMSNDFVVAIEEGATLIRIGSVLFEGIDETP
jgi:pyridoxal phosphate enzyme (YggS family)